MHVVGKRERSGMVTWQKSCAHAGDATREPVRDCRTPDVIGSGHRQEPKPPEATPLVVDINQESSSLPLNSGCWCSWRNDRAGRRHVTARWRRGPALSALGKRASWKGWRYGDEERDRQPLR